MSSSNTTSDNLLDIQRELVQLRQQLSDATKTVKMLLEQRQVNLSAVNRNFAGKLSTMSGNQQTGEIEVIYLSDDSNDAMQTNLDSDLKNDVEGDKSSASNGPKSDLNKCEDEIEIVVLEDSNDDICPSLSNSGGNEKNGQSLSTPGFSNFKLDDSKSKSEDKIKQELSNAEIERNDKFCLECKKPDKEIVCNNRCSSCYHRLTKRKKRAKHLDDEAMFVENCLKLGRKRSSRSKIASFNEDYLFAQGLARQREEQNKTPIKPKKRAKIKQQIYSSESENETDDDATSLTPFFKKNRISLKTEAKSPMKEATQTPIKNEEKSSVKEVMARPPVIKRCIDCKMFDEIYSKQRCRTCCTKFHYWRRKLNNIQPKKQTIATCSSCSEEKRIFSLKMCERCYNRMRNKRRRKETANNRPKKLPHRACIKCGLVKRIEAKDHCHSCYIEINRERSREGARKRQFPRSCMGCKKIRWNYGRGFCESCFKKNKHKWTHVQNDIIPMEVIQVVRDNEPSTSK